MKLAISNIGWDPAEQNDILTNLRPAGVEGIEIAPTKLWPGWNGASPAAARVIKTLLLENGFTCPALQALLFGLPDLQLFGDCASRNSLKVHLKKVGGIAVALGASVMVFGSPRNRDRGSLSSEQAMIEAASFFSEVGAELADLGVCLCIEANPEVYGCNFVTHWFEAAELVERVNSPGIGLHFDVACTVLSGSDPIAAIRSCAHTIRHFHISEPHLAPLVPPTVDHASVGTALRQSGYKGWISIEMRRGDPPLQAVLNAAAYAQRNYLGA